MKNSNILIAIATYKDAENIVKLIQQIRIYYSEIKILVINDFSNDGTREALDKLRDKNLIFLERPRKLGLGTAHKLSIFYAIKFQYDYLLTMDADLSHEPKSIPDLLNYVDKNMEAMYKSILKINQANISSNTREVVELILK